mmetsp:Transcript_7760/g.17911  ORF Transcript_7760/g.17911 Transcript_7760/m.17911 type:complete len:424 (-) Transcript_7760:994-2265(-)
MESPSAGWRPWKRVCRRVLTGVARPNPNEPSVLARTMGRPAHTFRKDLASGMGLACCFGCEALGLVEGDPLRSEDEKPMTNKGDGPSGRLSSSDAAPIAAAGYDAKSCSVRRKSAADLLNKRSCVSAYTRMRLKASLYSLSNTSRPAMKSLRPACASAAAASLPKPAFSSSASNAFSLLRKSEMTPSAFFASSSSFRKASSARRRCRSASSRDAFNSASKLPRRRLSSAWKALEDGDASGWSPECEGRTIAAVVFTPTDCVELPSFCPGMGNVLMDCPIVASAGLPVPKCCPSCTSRWLSGPTTRSEAAFKADCRISKSSLPSTTATFSTCAKRGSSSGRALMAAKISWMSDLPSSTLSPSLRRRPLSCPGTRVAEASSALCSRLGSTFKKPRSARTSSPASTVAPRLRDRELAILASIFSFL